MFNVMHTLNLPWRVQCHAYVIADHAQDTFELDHSVWDTRQDSTPEKARDRAAAILELLNDADIVSSLSLISLMNVVSLMG